MNDEPPKLYQDAYTYSAEFMRLMTMLTGNTAQPTHLTTAYNFCSKIISENRPDDIWSKMGNYWCGKAAHKLGKHDLSLIHFIAAHLLNHGIDFQAEILMAYSHLEMWDDVLSHGKVWLSNPELTSDYNRLEIMMYCINAYRNLGQNSQALDMLEQAEKLGKIVFPKKSEEANSFAEIITTLKSWIQDNLEHSKQIDGLLKNHTSLGNSYN
jgi:hypothetical protein